MQLERFQQKGQMIGKHIALLKGIVSDNTHNILDTRRINVNTKWHVSHPISKNFKQDQTKQRK